MTVLTETSRASFAWTGAETAFACGFPADKTADLQVFFTNALGVQQQLTLGVHFSATLASSTKLATVTPIALPAAPGTLVVQRRTPSLVAETLADGQEFSLAVLQRMFDRLAMSGAEFRTQLGRAIVLAEGAEPGTGSFNLLGAGIRNMAAGTLPNDAVTLAQLQAAGAADGNVPAPTSQQEGLVLLALAGGLFGWGQIDKQALVDGLLSADAGGLAKVADGFLAANVAGRNKMANKFVTLAKMDDIPTASIIGRVAAGTGAPQALTPAQTRSVAGVSLPSLFAASGGNEGALSNTPDFRLSLDFVPTGPNLFLSANLAYDGGAGAVGIFAYALFELYLLPASSLISTSIEQTTTITGAGYTQLSLAHIFSGLTVGNTYRVWLKPRVSSTAAPVYPRIMNISAVTF